MKVFDAYSFRTTLSDIIIAKTLFKSAINPATGRSDQRISTEQLVVLVR